MRIYQNSVICVDFLCITLDDHYTKVLKFFSNSCDNIVLGDEWSTLITRHSSRAGTDWGFM